MKDQRDDGSDNGRLNGGNRLTAENLRNYALRSERDAVRAVGCGTTRFKAMCVFTTTTI